MPFQRSALAVGLAAAFARRLDPDVPPDASHAIARVADAVAALGVDGDDRAFLDLVAQRVTADVTDDRFTPLPPVLFPPIVFRPSVAVVRESDLLVLRVSWRGARADGHVLRPDADAGEQAALIVELPPQHLMEQAYPVASTPSAPAAVRAALPSRLAFSLPAGESVALTARGVLAAMRRLAPRVVIQARPRATGWLPPWVIGGLVDRLDPLRLAGLDATEITARHLAVRRTLAGLGGVAAIAADPGTVGELRTLAQFAPGVMVTPGGRRAPGPFRPDDPGPDLGAILEALAHIPTDPPEDMTALELPTRLVLSPSPLGGWAHADVPVEGTDGTVELWHTRLGTRIVADDGTVTVDEDNGAQRIVRAVWSRDVPDGGDFPVIPPPEPEWSTVGSVKNPFRTSLTADQRVQIVSNTLSTQKGRTAPPVDVDALSLTPLGAWTDLHGTWDPDHGSVVGWDHRMAGGRDDFVRVVERYYGAPCGFRALWITETWREVVATDGMRGPSAVLRQREYAEFQEPVRRFSGAVAQGTPYVEVRVLVTRGPDMQPRSSVRSFVPTLLDGTPWSVPCVGTDADGVDHPLPLPMLFVRIDDNVSPDTTPYDDAAGTLAPYGAQPTPTGFTLTDPSDRLAVVTGGRRIAYAPRSAAGDMAHDTDQQRFAARLRVRDCDPVMVRADLAPAALTALTGRRTPMRVTYHPAYRSGGFAPGEVVLALTEASTEPPATPTRPHVTLPGGGESSGGLAAPEFDIGGLSRSLGVVGNPTAPADPKALLSGVKLFGVVPLADLIPTDLFAMPKLVQQVLDAVGAVGHDLHRLVDLGVAEATPALDALSAAVAGTLDPSTAFSAVQNALGAARARADATTPGLAALLRRIADGLATVLPAASTLADLVTLARSGTLPDPSHLRLHLTHATALGSWPVGAADPLVDGGELLLSIDVRGDGDLAPSTEVVAEIRDMTLTLVPGAGDLAKLVRLRLERLLVRLRAGSKPEVDVVLAPPEWLGVLSWVEDVMALIPADGFADPPYVEVDGAGARAGFSLALPDVAMGMFCLTNLAIAAEARVPWIGDGPSLWFAFCRRDRPFTLAVSLLGGGGYFGIEIGLGGVRSLEASFELGAVLALDFGVASGSVSVMAGIYFRLSGSDGTILGYLRIRGEVDVLGLISASITLAMELGYDAGKVVGRASITVEVSIAFFSTSVSISCEKKFAGSAGDPTFAELMGPADGAWAEYCAAFAPRGAA